MKKYTQEEFDAIERDEYGWKLCPTGDYTAIKIFGERCSFGEECSFGEWCSFGEGCSFGKACSFENERVKNGKYVAVDRMGNQQRKTYFFIDENGNMFVRVGCWFGSMDEFKELVKDVHGGTIHEKTYLAACDLAELMLKGNENV